MLKKQADRFFEWFCNPEYFADIQGDLEELYQTSLETKSKSQADWYYLRQVFLCLRLSLIKPIHLNNPFKYPIMFSHHTKTALRFMRKEKVYTALKIGGFSLGIASCLLLLIYLQYELSYDQHYKDRNLYRVNIRWTVPDIVGVSFPAPFAEVVKNEFPEVVRAGRRSMPVFVKGARNLIRRSDKTENFYEEGVTFMDQELLDMLEVPMVYGDRGTALAQPNRVVLSRSIAEKYFPDEDPVGKTIVVNDQNEDPITVGGVMEDFPSNSHLEPFNILFTMEGVEWWNNEQTDWCCNNYRTYVELQPGTDPEQFKEKLATIKSTYYLPAYTAMGNTNPKKELEEMDMFLQPIEDVHLDSEVLDQLAHGDMRLIWIFGSAAILILLLACINFINLSTARSANRAREVGIRRTTGAFRKQLVSQFLMESLLYSIFSFILGTLLAYVLLPYFNQLSGKPLEIPWQAPWFFPLLTVSAIIVGLISGLYPAMYLSSFKPIQVMKGGISLGSKNPTLRNNLVVFQFTASIVLLIGTGIVNQQLSYILNKKIGFEKDQVLMLQGTNTLGDKIQTFKGELTALPEVQSATVTAFLPVEGAQRNGTGFILVGEGSSGEEANGQQWRVDYDYIQTLGMNIVAGRDFNPEMRTDSQSVVINQEMARKLGLEDPIGQQIDFIGGTWTVIGVVEDFHFESLRQEVRPIALWIGNSTSRVAIRAKSTDMPQVLARVKGVWKEFAPNQPMRYQFMDESYAHAYEDVKRSGNMFTSFAGLAIIIACLGLFGLTAYIAEQRTKEIGIRKVLGASVKQIVELLSKDFVKLVLLSILIASPLAWYIMRQWLQSFAYQIDIPIWIFVSAGLITLIIAFLTMSYHSVKTALEDPVKSIRTE